MKRCLVFPAAFASALAFGSVAKAQPKDFSLYCKSYRISNADKIYEILSRPGLIEEQMKTCKHDLSKWLGHDERIVNSICNVKNDVVITNRYLYNISKEYKDGKLLGTFSRIDISKVMEQGFVAGTASEDTVFVITKDKMLTVIPLTKETESWNVYELPVNANDTKMAYHAGLLFVASKGMILSLAIGDKIEMTRLDFSSKTKGKDFFFNGGRLYFGNSKIKVEIRVDGNKAEVR